jgi:phenylpropionate dioxygenase-like ring-hydroxylating dioxygenase large terminal subunit
MVLTKEENDRLTRVGAGTPGGEFMRRYWQPAALAEELPVGGAPIPVRLLGEDLVMFRDDDGRPGLLGIHCPHRGADLSYGRLEDGGLRCIYHGWLFDRSGKCLEQPGEPEGSTFHERIRQRAYPCIEQAGIIFAYMGPGEPPLLPTYEFLTSPDEYRFVTKYFQDDNYLQGNEGNFDPQHLSFLHQFLKPKDGDFRNDIHGRDPTPQIEPVDTDFGMHLYAIRHAGGDRSFVKVRSFFMPSGGAVGSRGEEGYSVNWHVPIDDEHHWRYSIFFQRTEPLAQEEIRRARASLADNYRLTRNRANRYLQDREEMKTETFLGVGRDFVVHDTLATEGEGPIYDRTSEHLGYTDRGLIHMRRIMLEAIKDVEEGRDPRGVVRDVELNEWPDLIARDDILPSSIPWKDHWKADRTPAGAGAR